MRPSDAKYSPGPWSVSKKSKLTGAVVAEDGEVACDPTGAGRYEDEDEAEANANWISATPELLECLKMLYAIPTVIIGEVVTTSTVNRGGARTIDTCTEQKWPAAIRKAEGLDGSDAGSSGA